MHINEITALIVDAAVRIHTGLGPGLLESVYEELMEYELLQLGLHVERQAPIPVVWGEKKLERGFRADLIVERCVVIEIKSVETLAEVHYKQVLTYVKLADVRVGLLLNFGAARMKEGIKRVVNRLPENDDWHRPTAPASA